ncbi:MAG: glycosyltransferase [Bacteroidia bacterium]
MKVSVSIITYNQEKYIAKAIESVLMQEVDFDYEIIIGDDCSTDGTQAIIEKYRQQYPELIRFIAHKERYSGVPGRLNLITNIQAAKGEYVALLDGDDYWLDKHKLQQQVTFLDENPDYVMCFHDAIVESDENNLKPFLYSKQLRLSPGMVVEHNELVSRCLIPASSTVYRRSVLSEIPEWFWEVYSGTWILQMLISKKGRVKYFHDLKYRYTVNKGSISHRDKLSLDVNRIKIRQTKTLQKHFPEVPGSVFRHKLAALYFRRAIFASHRKDFLRVLLYLLKSALINRKAFMIMLKKYGSRVNGRTGGAIENGAQE